MSEPSSPIRSEDFWFEDGDIVLSVTEDGVEHHFRVHSAILSIASLVFRDMLTMPQPSEECENPSVPLRDDAINDLKALLGAVYHKQSVESEVFYEILIHCFLRKAQTQTLDAVLGIMRLSHKYQIEGLQQEMQQRLQEDWPVNHSDYLARITYLGSLEYRVPQAMKLIETAQRCHANELFPTAFYELACAWGTGWTEISNVLSPENVVRLTKGLARSQHRLRALVTLNSPSSDPPMWNTSPPSKTIFNHRTSFGKCQKHSHYAYDVYFCGGGSSALRSKLSEYLFDGMFMVPALMQCDSNSLKDTCVTCKDWYMDILKNKVQELWENIPADFDLPAVDPELYSKSIIRIL